MNRLFGDDPRGSAAADPTSRSSADTGADAQATAPVAMPAVASPEDAPKHRAERPRNRRAPEPSPQPAASTLQLGVAAVPAVEPAPAAAATAAVPALFDDILTSGASSGAPTPTEGATPTGRRARVEHTVSREGEMRGERAMARERARAEVRRAAASIERPVSIERPAVVGFTPSAEVIQTADRAPQTPPASPTSRRAARRLLAVSAVAGLAALAGIGVIATTAANSPDSSSAGDSASSGDAVEAASTATIKGGLSETAAPFTGGTSVTVAGERLDEVAEVSVGGEAATILDASAAHLTFAVPATSDDALGDVAVEFADAEGRPVEIESTTGDGTASAGASGDTTEATDPATAPGPLKLTYTSDPGIDAQLAYVLAHWNDYNTADYPVVRGADAVNFASQSLIVRGWTMDDVWNADRASGTMSAAWSSSTALRDYLLTRTDRATELTDAQRDQVKVGDITQFDWDGSGDRDHTAVVTRVEHTDAGTKVWVGGHSTDVQYWDVDAALAAEGGSVSYFSIH